MSDENAIDNPLNLDIPDHLQYSEEHVWVDDSVSPAIVGITAYAEQQLGELASSTCRTRARAWRPATRP